MRFDTNAGVHDLGQQPDFVSPALVDHLRFDPESIHNRFVLSSVDHVAGVLGASAIGWDIHLVEGFSATNGAVNRQTSPLWRGYIIDAMYTDGEDIRTETVILSEPELESSFVPKVLATLKQRAAEHTYGLVPNDKHKHTTVIFGTGATNTSFKAWLRHQKPSQQRRSVAKAA
jgi:hypothetical protein